MEILKTHVKDFPSAQWTSSESPDFIIGSLGIEVRRIMGEKLKKKYSYECKIIYEAKKKYELDNLSNIFLSANFYKEPLNIDINTQIYQEVKGKILSDKNQNHSIKFTLEGVYVHIIQSKSLTRNIWRVGGGGYVNKDIKKIIQCAIGEKNYEYENYRRKCDACWLIIGVENFDKSSLYELTGDSINHPYRSFFERTYFIDLFSKKVTELKTINT